MFCSLKYIDRTLAVRLRAGIEDGKPIYEKPDRDGAEELIDVAKSEAVSDMVRNHMLFAMLKGCDAQAGYQDSSGAWQESHIVNPDLPLLRRVNNSIDRYVVRMYCCEGICAGMGDCQVHDATIDMITNPGKRLPAGAIDNRICRCPPV